LTRMKLNALMNSMKDLEGISQPLKRRNGDYEFGRSHSKKRPFSLDFPC